MDNFRGTIAIIQMEKYLHGVENDFVLTNIGLFVLCSCVF